MSVSPDISLDLFGVKLTNPTILASGVLGTTRDILASVSEAGAGAVTIKSISVEPRQGHPNPSVLSFESGLINAVGYSNPGLKIAAKEFSDLSHLLCPVIGSVIGTHLGEFAEVAAIFELLPFFALEIPVSCPHTPGFGKMAAQDNPEMINKITKVIRDNSSKPVIIKLPPASNQLIEMALAAEEAGASAITAVNTVGPGMLIDADVGKPVLGFGVGGLSGPALKPLALAAVFQLYKAINIPIIGTGGISNGRDAIEMIMAGATAIGIGSAVRTHGLQIFRIVAEEMKEFLTLRGDTSLSAIRGIAHEI